MFPGKDTQTQLDLIFNTLGTPNEEEIESIPREKGREFLKSLQKKKGKGLENIFSFANPLAIDLLRKMLSFNQKKRITVEQALEHPYFSTLHFPEDEPAALPLSRYDFQFECQLLTGKQLKDLIYEEILFYHFPEKVKLYEQLKAKFEADYVPLEIHSNFQTDQSSSETDFF